jgi:hypothetical protein
MAGRVRLRPLTSAAVVLLSAGCAKDVILPVASVCGNFEKEASEECDIKSVGCVECKVAKGWTCDDEKCTPTCGDGMVLGDEECDPPDGLTCDSSCQSGEKTEACDMSGYWIVRQTDFSKDDVLNQVQTSSNWFAFKLVQTGDSFHVDSGIFCGIKVTGSATAQLSEDGVRGLIHENPMDSDTPAPRQPRAGSFVASGTDCVFDMDRAYLVRGVEARFLPPDFLTKPALSSLVPLPFEDDPAHPTGAHLDGAVDSDGDGHPGVAFRISGNVSGVRNVAQRDWNEYFTAPEAPIPQNAIEFVARVRFDNQENILHLSGCPRLGCGLLKAGSVPDTTRQDRVTLRYLGASLADARVSRIVKAELKQDIDRDMETCDNVRNALVHDDSRM